VVAYLVVYALMTLGAFAVVAAAEAAGAAPDAGGLAGLARRAPALAVPLAVFMASLTGLPPLGGFIAKFAVFREVWRAGHPALVLLALATSVVSVGFYLRLLVPVFMEPGEDGARPLVVAPSGEVVAAFLAVLVLAAGMFPGPLLAFAGLAAP
jgi:NADH-quinone oxidoreductase subunit N